MRHPDILTERMARLGMTKQQLADKSGIAYMTVSNILKKGPEKAGTQNVLAICKALGLDPKSLMDGECILDSQAFSWASPLVDAYLLADAPIQTAACAVLGIPRVIPNEAQAEIEPDAELIEMSIYDDSAAAGAPLPAADSLERMSFKKGDVPNDADFGVRICGDSMSPEIQDGDIVWIYQTTELRNGEVGVFMLDDGAVCKRIRLIAPNRLQRLDSDNPVHPPIEGSDLQGFRAVGRVVGVYRS